MVVQLHLFLTSALEGEMSVQLHASATLTPGKDAGAQEGGWAPETVWALRRKAESRTPVGIRNQTVQPVAWSLYRPSYIGT